MSDPVWAWGDNEEGQQGLGFAEVTVADGEPRMTRFPAKAVKLAAGGRHVLLLDSDGYVWTAGQNELGECGRGFDSTHESIPARVVDGAGGYLSNIVDISATLGASAAVNASGAGYSWGQNFNARLGIGDLDSGLQFNTPQSVLNVSGCTQVQMRTNNSYWLCGGSVKACGSNSTGACGNGTFTGTGGTGTAHHTPVTVLVLSGVSQIAGGETCCLALEGGQVYSWGSGATHRTGHGNTTNRHTPTAIAGLSTVTAIAMYSATGMAMLADQTLKMWGRNLDGQTGIGSVSASVSTPTATLVIDDALAISAGDRVAGCIRSTHRLWTWGEFVYGGWDNAQRASQGEHTPGIVSMLEATVRHYSAGQTVSLACAPADKPHCAVQIG